jgi:activator of HSP90 ATPase
MLLTDLHQSEIFNTTALDIYTILTDERRHGSFTGDDVFVSETVGDSVSLKDGAIIGKAVVLERGKKIIWSLTWLDANWPQNHISEAEIILTDNADGTCTLALFHTNIPKDFLTEIKAFWLQHYWESLRYYLER